MSAENEVSASPSLPGEVREEADQGHSVGYKRPPQHTRFQAGRSGNPRGRPRTRKNLKTMAKEVLQQPVVMMEKGRRRTVPALQAVMQKVLSRALRDGDPRALSTILALAGQAGLADETLPEAAGGLSAEEREVLEALRASFEQGVAVGSGGEDKP